MQIGNGGDLEDKEVLSKPYEVTLNMNPLFASNVFSLSKFFAFYIYLEIVGSANFRIEYTNSTSLASTETITINKNVPFGQIEYGKAPFWGSTSRLIPSYIRSLISRRLSIGRYLTIKINFETSNYFRINSLSVDYEPTRIDNRRAN